MAGSFFGGLPPDIVSNACARLPTSLWPRLCSGGGPGRGELHVLDIAEKRDEVVESEAWEYPEDAEDEVVEVWRAMGEAG